MNTNGSPARRLQVPVLSAALCAVLLPSCANIKETLRLEGRMFVKVPPPPGSFVRRKSGAVTTGDWTFWHVLEAPKTKLDAGDWYMATHASGKDRTRTVLFTTQAERRARKLAPEVVQAVQDAFHVWPSVVEPAAVFKARAGREKEPVLSATDAGGPHAVASLNKSSWPAVRGDDGLLDPGWHLRDRYSQLDTAKARVRCLTGSAGGGLKVAILDNGFDNRVAALPGPKKLMDLAESDTIGYLQQTKGRRMVKPGDLHSSHGTATLSVLAGSQITIPDSKKVHGWTGEPGGVPDATIYPMAVAPWVASPTTANLARAIDLASREYGCDIISMSHGGAPTRMWADAVNAAYDRGTAIFAATADYVNLPYLSFGIGVPSASVYPAAFRRAMAVGGVTAARRSYGITDPNYPQLSFGSFVRASYGPDGTAWRRNKAQRMADADHSQARRLGVLHAHPVNGWAPNVLCFRPAKKDGTRTRRVDLDFGGASAAVPQVAAAGALWLAAHRREIEAAGQWHGWQKAQAVYHALLASAERPWEPNSRLRQEDQQPDLYLGAGFVRASDALDWSFAEVKRLHGSTLKWDKSTQDFYDGDRSAYRLLKLRLKVNDVDLNSRLYPLPDMEHREQPANFEDALYTVFYNQALNHEWRQSALPLKNCRNTTGLPKPSLLLRLFGRVPRDRCWVEERAQKWVRESGGVRP